MLLNAEIKDDNVAELPRAQDAQYPAPQMTYLKADASTGQNYVDLNAAAKSYAGAWLFGRQQVVVNVNRMRAQWMQWCPVPAGIADGVLLKGNVIYENSPSSYRTSADRYEGVIRTEGGERFFIGKTQHTFVGRNLPGGQMKVVADLRIPLTQRLAYNPMMVHPQQQQTMASQNSQPGYGAAPNQYYGGGQQATYRQPSAYAQQQANTATYGQEPDSGF